MVISVLFLVLVLLFCFGLPYEGTYSWTFFNVGLIPSCWAAGAGLGEMGAHLTDDEASAGWNADVNSDDSGVDIEEDRLSGWEMHWSSEYERHFYFHPGTGESSWEMPLADAAQGVCGRGGDSNTCQLGEIANVSLVSGLWEFVFSGSGAEANAGEATFDYRFNEVVDGVFTGSSMPRGQAVWTTRIRGTIEGYHVNWSETSLKLTSDVAAAIDKSGVLMTGSSVSPDGGKHFFAAKKLRQDGAGPWQALVPGDQAEVQKALLATVAKDGQRVELTKGQRGTLLDVEAGTGRWRLSFESVGVCWIDAANLYKLGKVWVRWHGSAVENITAARFCALLGDAHADDMQRKPETFNGWTSEATLTIPFPYAVRPSHGRGLGLFTRVRIAAGAVVHTDRPDFYLRLPEGLLDLAEDVAAACSARVVRRLTTWCVLDWTSFGDGILCELDDGRYVNDRNEDEEANVATCPHDPYSTCATQVIEAGEELVEDYLADELDDSISQDMTAALQEAAEDHSYLSSGGAGCSAILDKVFSDASESKEGASFAATLASANGVGDASKRSDSVIQAVASLSVRRVGRADLGMC